MRSGITGTFVICLLLFSCTAKKKAGEQPVSPGTRGVTGVVNNDSIALPERIPAAPPQIVAFTKTVISGNANTAGVGKTYFTHLSAEKGYRTGWVNNFLFDRNGTAWIAGETALLRYDGIGFTEFNSKNGIQASSINSMVLDDRGDLWLTRTNGISRYDGHAFTNYDSFTVVKNGSWYGGLQKDHNGNIWFAAYGRGIIKYDGRSFTAYGAREGLPSDTLNNLMVDKEGKLWLSTRDGRIGTFDGKTYTRIKTEGWPPTYKVNRVFQDRLGNIWFPIYGKGLMKFDGQNCIPYTDLPGLPSDKVFEIAQDSNGNYWFASSEGLFHYDGIHLTRYTTGDGLGDLRVHQVTEDPAGNIWVKGSSGLNKFNGTSITEYGAAEGFRGSQYGSTNFINDRDGHLWFTIIGGIGKYDGKDFTYYKVAGADSSKIINNLGSLYEDKDGNIWFSIHEKGCYRFDGKKLLLYPEIRTAFSGILQDSKGMFWFTSYQQPLVKFDGTSFTRYGTAQGLPVGHGASLIEDRSGNIWMGNSLGISKFDGNRFTQYKTDDGADLGSSFLRVVTDKNGWIWFGSDTGLIKFDGRSMTYFESFDGMANTYVDQILEDTANKKIWLTTSYGLSAVNTGLKDEKTGMERVENYNYQTGFPGLSKQFNGAFLDHKGILWLSDSKKALTRFDYGQLKKYRVPELLIKNVTLANENISWHNLKRSEAGNAFYDSIAVKNETNIRFLNNLTPAALKDMSDRFAGTRFDSISPGNLVPIGLEIPYRHNNIGFEFAAIDPANAGQVQYQYMLEGYDKSWSKLDFTTKVSFGNMSEGHYTFRLKALCANGQWAETSYAFTVLPPWYRTWWAYALYALFFITGIYLFIRWRTKALQKEKLVLEEKVNTRTAELKESLENLKATQSQLIQSEKMASLGELTAGIAHEIQNPLNFVNNFSEVNSELADELKNELATGNVQSANEIATDIKENSEKINHHGKRADAIVKGMLQHSRSSSGVKEPTDINALCDEYLRLAYHGLRAKDKSFNATMKTDFDESIGNINIIPQDIGRVILNLITNAFYVVNEKKTLRQAQGDNYEPTVSVSTKKINGKIEINVADNGNGIPQKVLDKIFQPFFTTKPTGQGTGLGLSLSYDIVKAHGGEIKVNTNEGEGTEFIIQLPVN